MAISQLSDKISAKRFRKSLTQAVIRKTVDSHNSDTVKLSTDLVPMVASFAENEAAQQSVNPYTDLLNFWNESGTVFLGNQETKRKTDSVLVYLIFPPLPRNSIHSRTCQWQEYFSTSRSVIDTYGAIN